MDRKRLSDDRRIDTTEPSTGMSAEHKALSNLTQLIVAVSAYVHNENLAAIKEPRWTLTRDEIPFSAGKWLHQLYLERDCAFPKELIIIGGLPFSLVFFAFYAIFYLVVTTQMPAEIRISLGITASLFIIPMTPIALFNALGAYWLLAEVLANRRLPWWTKLLAGGAVIAAAIPWFVLKVWRAFGITFSEVEVNRMLQGVQSSYVYGTIFGLLVAIPAMIYLSFGGLREFVLFGIKAYSTIRWLLRFHKLESPETLMDFLNQPISLDEMGSTFSLLKLNQDELQALSAWAECRRDLVQSRLLPTTLLLTFLGLLANTSLADSAVLRFGDLVNTVLRPPDFWSWLGAYLVVLVVISSGALLTKVLVGLANESFVMDYIAQACVLAKSAKKQTKRQQAEEMSQEEKIELRPSSRHHWWKHLFGGRK